MEAQAHPEIPLRIAGPEELRTTIETMQEGLVVQEASGRIVLWNSAAERILGLTGDQLSGRTSFDPQWQTVRADGTPFPPEEHPSMVTLRTGVPQSDVVMGVLRPGGGTAWISISSQPLARGGDGHRSVVVTFRDITREREALSELRRREALLRATLDSLPAGLFISSIEDRRVLRFNEPLVAILGLQEREAELREGGLRDSDVQAHLRAQLADPRHLDAHVRRTEGLAGTELVETELALRDGRMLRCAARRLQDENGHAVGLLHVVEDVTARVRSEEERRTLDRRMQDVQRLESLGVLAGGIAHDFNNLLTSIVGSAELAAMTAAEGTPLARQMERVLLASSRATLLCQQMLSYAGSSPADVRRLHLSDAMREAVHWLQPQLGARVRLEVDLAPELPALLADPAQLHQMAVHLLNNAAESIGPEGGVVRVSTGVSQRAAEDFARAAFSPSLPAGDYLHVEIADSGCGIDPKVLARIFDPFFSTKFSGSGLGLSAVLGIVRRHRGALFVESTVGRGTTTRVLLPAAPIPGVP